MSADGITFLLLEDEPLILLDLEFAVEDAGGQFVSATHSAQALAYLSAPETRIDVGILDVNLGRGETCEAVAAEMRRRNIPFIIHSGDLNRRNETISALGARVIAKPASTQRVISAALDEISSRGSERAPIPA